MFIRKKGQGTIEYAMVIAIVVAALIAMQVYLKRGLQGRLRQASDDIGSQYSPGFTTSNTRTTTHVESTETVEPVTVGSETVTQSTVDSDQTQRRIVNEQVAEFTEEYWAE